MASPPYTIATTTPADTDIISIFPGQERPYRDVVWSWLNQIANATTGNLNPSAFPSFVNSWVVQSVDVNTDAVLTYQNSSGVKRSRSLWNHTSDKHTILTYAVDGTTIKTQLDLIGGAGTANVNVAAGTLTVGGTAVVLTNSAVATAITGTGALTAGSIGGSFGAINIGANTLTAGATTIGALSATTGAFSGALTGTSGAFTGAMVASNYQAAAATPNQAILGTNGLTAGTVILRPNGVSSATAQWTLSNLGNVSAGGTSNATRQLENNIPVYAAPFCILEDQEPQNTGGGTCTAGGWRQRPLNTKVRDPDSLVTLSSNTFVSTVNAWCEWEGAYTTTGKGQSRLFNVTDSTVAGVGLTDISGPSGAPVIAGKTYQVEQWVTATGTFGAAGNISTEVYTRVKLMRI